MSDPIRISCHSFKKTNGFDHGGFLSSVVNQRKRVSFSFKEKERERERERERVVVMLFVSEMHTFMLTKKTVQSTADISCQFSVFMEITKHVRYM